MSRQSRVTRTVSKASRSKKTTTTGKPAVVPYHNKPESLDFAEWQTALRKQFIPKQDFKIVKLSDTHAIFGDYSVYNPESRGNYKVALRDAGKGLNYCDCLDFKTNTLGTCKHIEGVIRKVSGKRGAKKAFKEGFVPPYTSVFLHYGDTRRVRIRVGTDNSEEFTGLAQEFFDADQTLKPESMQCFESFLSRACALDSGFRCYDDALAFILAERASEYRRKIIENKYQSPASTEGLLKTRLYPYQRQGILFAAKAGRSLLADEMGLGKTIQAIGAAELLKREAGVEKVLVVCPSSLKYQWRSEIMKFSESSVQVLEGQSLTRERQYKQDSFYKIVSYHAVMHDTEAIAQMAPDLVILDEAQRIKNWKTRIARTVKGIQSPYALVLTGTPLENRLEELYSIVSFINPYKLGPFWRFLAEHQVKDDSGKITGYQGLQEIGTALSDISLRRRKKEVLADLPARIDKRVFVPMTDRQRNLHEEFGAGVARLIHKWRRFGHLLEQDRQKLLILLNQMRMACDSTYILDQDHEHRHDTKIDELMSVLDESLVDPEQKVVVFSQWERMTRIVAMELDERGIGYRSLHGGVPSAQRKELYDSFNTLPGCRVFLSTDAGSTGLNLQAASILVNLDLPWNPAILEQRIGRIHRIGQKKNITVLNFVSIDTIESRMLDLINFKSRLAQGILDAGEDVIFMDKAQHNRFMKTVETIVAIPNSTENSKEDILETQDQVATGAHSIGEVEVSEARELAGEAHTGPGKDAAELEAVELVAKGMSFFTDLSRRLATPGGAEALVSALSETDPSTGKTYLKIPVEDSKAAADAIAVVARIFSAMSAPQ
jgi:superfamily II DNA or RNA helicase